MAGNGKLNGVPIAASWTENFSAAVSPRRSLVIDAVIDDDARQRFDLPYRSLCHWTARRHLRLYRNDAHHATLSAILDAREAHAEIAELGWDKPPGDDATAQFDIDLIDGHAAVLRDAFVKGAGLTGDISGKFKPDGGLSSIDIKRLTYGDTDLHGRVAWRDAGGYDLDIGGAGLDWSIPYNAKQTTLDDNEPTVPLNLTLKLDRLVLVKMRASMASMHRPP